MFHGAATLIFPSINLSQATFLVNGFTSPWQSLAQEMQHKHPVPKPSHLASSLKRARTTSTIYESWAIVVRHWELALHQWKICKSTTTEDLHFPYTEGG